MGHLGFASLVHIQNKAKLCLSASLGEAQFCTSPELGNTSKFPWGKKRTSWFYQRPPPSQKIQFQA